MSKRVVKKRRLWNLPIDNIRVKYVYAFLINLTNYILPEVEPSQGYNFSVDAQFSGVSNFRKHSIWPS